MIYEVECRYSTLARRGSYFHLRLCYQACQTHRTCPTGPLCLPRAEYIVHSPMLAIAIIVLALAALPCSAQPACIAL